MVRGGRGVSRESQDGNIIHWRRPEADKIAACTNQQYREQAKLPKSFQVSEPLLEEVSKIACAHGPPIVVYDSCGSAHNGELFRSRSNLSRSL